MKTLKVKFWTYTQNLGDGSCAVKYFKSKENAEKYASYDEERMCDDIDQKELEFDLNGNLLSLEPKVDNWVKEQAAKRFEYGEKS